MADSPYQSLYDSSGNESNLDPLFLRAQAIVESHENPNAVSPAGAIGISQFMPDTAKTAGPNGTPIDPTKPEQAIPAQGRMMDGLLQKHDGDVNAALTEYVGGPDPSKWGPVTAAYPGKVAAAYTQLQKVKAMAPTPLPESPTPDFDALLSRTTPTTPTPLPESPTPDFDRLLAPPVQAPAPAQPGFIASTADQAAQGFWHGLSSVGDTIGGGLNQLAAAADARYPVLGAIDQQYGINPAANLASHNALTAARNQQYDATYGVSPVAGVANMAGQVVGTAPLLGPLGRAGVALTDAGASFLASPALNTVIRTAGRLATGSAEGATAAAATGGDVQGGAIGGSVVRGAGIGLGIGSAALQSTSAGFKAVADKVVQGVTNLVSAHFGGIEGFLTSGALAPTISEINKQYGPRIGNLVAQRLNSSLGASVGGTIGGKIGAGTANPLTAASP